MIDTILELQNITKNYGKACALNSFSYCFTPGVYGILGPNGAGKTTLMNIITDNLRPTSGVVRFNSADIHSLGSSYLAELGYMPQQQAVFSELTVERFLFYMSALKGVKKAQAKIQVEELLNTVNLYDSKNKLMRQLSGGMKQRALIASSLLGFPHILIMDEPTAGLDPKERIRIRNLISKVSSDKIILISTHVVQDIEAIAKEIIILKTGEIECSGQISELLKRLKGRVFDIPSDPSELPDIETAYKCSNIQNYGDKVVARVISDSVPDRPHTNAEGTLEELYLDIFG